MSHAVFSYITCTIKLKELRQIIYVLWPTVVTTVCVNIANDFMLGLTCNVCFSIGHHSGNSSVFIWSGSRLAGQRFIFDSSDGIHLLQAANVNIRNFPTINDRRLRNYLMQRHFTVLARTNSKTPVILKATYISQALYVRSQMLLNFYCNEFDDDQ
jgi:hypothetical protein